MDERAAGTRLVENQGSGSNRGDATSVHALVERQVERSPDAIALICGSVRLSYRELNSRANALAHHLIAVGVGRGDRVCLLHDRACDMVVAVLGILKAGAAYVPMDTAYPAARLRHIVSDCAASAVVTQERWAANFSSSGAVPVVCMDSDRAAISRQPDTNPVAGVTPDDEVYCIYTSGSTGNPKGTILFHRGAVGLYLWYTGEFGMGTHTSFIVLSSIGHDITQKGIFAPLICGGRVVLLDSQTYDAGLVLDTIEREQVSCISFVPTALYGFLDGADDHALRQLASLTHIFPGGEGLHPKRLRAWLAHPSCRVEVVNTYGPTECTDLTSTHRVTADDLVRYADGILPLGVPIGGARLYVLDEQLKEVAQGEKGELCIAGNLVGGGYINRPDLQEGKFVPSPFVPGDTLYRSGDLVSRREDGILLYHARVDHQVKVRGYRIELPEVETAVATHPAVKQAVVTAREDAGREVFLAAYVVLHPGQQADAGSLRDHSLALLPEYMVPSTWTVLDRFPLNEANKVDRKALPDPSRGRPTLPSAFRAPQDPLQESLAALWRDLLGFAEVGIDDRFFEAGGTSLKALQFVARVGQLVGARIPIAQFFANPTIASFAAWLAQRQAKPAAAAAADLVATPANTSSTTSAPRRDAAERIAIVGMAGRFAGADTLDQFWTLIEQGDTGIRTLSDADLDAAGVSAELRSQSNYVRAAGWIEGADCFDTAFFGVTPREASLMDPQQRALLETAYSALEHAGCDPRRFPGRIGIYAGVARNQYFTCNLASHAQFRTNDMDHVLLGSDKDYTATRIAFKLDLRGPAMSIQNACSTSGVAMHTACQALRYGDCDAAIIGGASIPVPFRRGHQFIEGGPLSRDGRIRPFDANASGMVLTAGVACLVLKRLADAEADGDTIYAIVAGSALNNDGGDKIAFTAPSVSGQTAVIQAALKAAGVAPESVSYIETHGTGTPLGDPIEIAGLSQAYAGARLIALGSVKANIGHLDAGAAAAGLIKTALALHHRVLPPMAHFESANPECGFEGSPFTVSAQGRAWDTAAPRRAGVSSFGFGGTNFHALLEEAPQRESSASTRAFQLLHLSAKTDAALKQQAARLADWLQAHPQAALADVAYTLDQGRTALENRAVVVARDTAQAQAQLRSTELLAGGPSHAQPSLVFLFPGQGAQHLGMGRRLYETESVFRAEVDRCAAILKTPLGLDLRELLYPAAELREQATATLRATQLAQPAIFTISYATARLWMSRGLHPEAMIGHSVGEYVAAALAGVFELEHVLLILAERARLMQSMPSGGMLAVKLPEAEALKHAVDGIALAGVNAPNLSVMSGPHERLAALRAQLSAQGVGLFELHTSHAFHSEMMEPVVPLFTRVVGQYPLSAPRLPFYSSLTGAPITAQQAQDPAYWAQQLRRAVRFAPALMSCAQRAGRVFLEVGPGQNLTTSSRQSLKPDAKAQVIASLPHPNETGADDAEHLALAMGRLWLAGIEVDPRRYYAGETRHKIGLPTYPFARNRHWVEPAAAAATIADSETTAAASSAAESTASADAAAAPTESTVRRRLRGLLEEHSGVAFSEEHDDTAFVELGLDSLTLTMVVADLEKEFGIKVSFRSLMADARTLTRLATDIEARVGATAAPKAATAASAPSAIAAAASTVATAATPAEKLPIAGARRSSTEAEVWQVPDPQRPGAWIELRNGELQLAGLPAVGSESEQPFSAAQREMWLAMRFNPEVTLAYNMVSVLTLDGLIHRPAMSWAWLALLARHPLLRARVDDESGVWKVPGWCHHPLKIEDLSGFDVSRQVAMIAAFEKQAAETPFDLSLSPPVRAQLLIRDGFTAELLINVHHMACDGWSAAVLLKDLARLYSYAIGAGPAVTDEAPTATAYCQAEQSFHASKDYAERRDYWLQHLQAAPSPLEWPLSHTRPATRQSAAARVHRRLDAELTRELRKLAGRSEGSLLSVLLSGFSAMTQRLTGANEMVVGLTTAGQPLHGFKNLVSHCVNLLPSRISVKPEASFIDNAKATAAAVMDAMDHQGPTYGSLLGELKLPRDESRLPLISTIFNVDVRNENIAFAGLEWSIRHAAHASENFEMLFNVIDGGQEILLQCSYHIALYDEPTMQRRLREYECLLRAAVQQGDKPVHSLSLLDAAARLQLTQEFNDTERAYALDAPLHRLIEQQVKATPDAPALVSDQETLSYAVLNARANQLAHALIARGVKPDDIVAVCAQRGIGMVVGMLATLKAGAAYLPLDPAYPAERLGFMLEDSASPVILVEIENSLEAGEEVRKLLADRADRVLDLKRDTAQWAQLPAHDPQVAVGPEHLAYVIFTSGSTGKPKGAMLEHRGIVNRLLWMQEEYRIGAGDRVLQKTPYSFDVSVWEFFWPLLTGATLVMARPEGHKDPRYLAELINRERITTCHFVPSMLGVFMEEPDSASCQGLRQVFCSGEALSYELTQRFYAKLPNAELHNLYGPTEASVDVSYWACPKSEKRGIVPIGRPVANTQLYVLDAQGQPLPIGVAGELMLGGVQLARGYLNRPELTAEKFITHPEFGRLYRTGDLSRWLSDGNVEYLGRLDFQVKLHGFRIELGEIEAELARHPQVIEAAAGVVSRGPGDQRLAAWFVARGAAPSVSELREHLRQTLPPHMVPNTFLQMDQLPLLSNGKMDRKALPNPFTGAEARGVARTAPRTAAEIVLRDLWAETIGVSEIGVEDRFFDLGGHSLLALQVVAKLRERHGVNLPLRALINEPLAVIAALLPQDALPTASAPPAAEVANPLYEAPVIGARLGRDADGNPAWYVDGDDGDLRAVDAMDQPLAHDPFAGPALAASFPITAPQREIVLACRLDASVSSGYHLSGCVQLDGALDLGVLRRALGALASRHESLRTCISPDGERLMVLERVNVALPVEECPGDDPIPQASALHAQALPLEQAPIWRAALLRRSADRHWLILTFHHVICDGFSRAQLSEELAALYTAGAQNQKPALAAAPRFGDYVQRVQQRGAVDLTQWIARLQSPPPTLEWPLDHARPAARDFSAGMLDYRFAPGLAARLREAARSTGTSPIAFLTAALSAFSSRLTGQTDQIIAIPIAGQMIEGMPQLAGHCASVVPLRLDARSELTFRDHLSAVSARVGEALEDPHATIGELLPQLRLPRQEDRPQLVSTILDYVPVSPLPNFGVLTSSEQRIPTTAEFFELFFTFYDRGDNLSLDLYHSTALYTESSLRGRLRLFEALLESVCSDCSRPLAALELLSPKEREHLTDTLNPTATPIDYRPVHERVALRAGEAGTRIAVSFGAKHYRYDELDARANAIASALQQRGVGPGQFVAVCVERGLDLPAALLGVLKTGAAYLPLDPDFPEERLAYMLADSRATAAVTESTLSARLASSRCPLLALEDVPASGTPTPVPRGPNDAAYVIYTSGSTGKPKGVVVPHGGLCNFLDSMAQAPGMGADDALLAATTVSFDIAGLELYLPLILGARVVIADRETAIDGHRLAALLAAEKIDVMQATPATWRLLLAADWAGHPRFRGYCGGEPLPRDLAEQLLSRVGQLWNLYGPTETTIWSTASLVRSAEGPMLIGTPIANTRCYILDSRNSLLPQGAIGELWIGGDGVAIGYHDRAELTAERFLPDPYSAPPGARMYRTGDLARWTASGELECLGRTDFQVKLRGYRIELGEIESELNGHPSIADSACGVRDRSPGDPRLVAWVVGAANAAVSPGELREHLRQGLPSYMVPQTFRVLERLPRLPNGKLDRKALPDPFASAEDIAAPKSPPETPTEQALHDVWAEILCTQDIGIDDRFFDLGGHSLLAMQTAALMQKRFGVKLPLRTLMMESLRVIAEGVDRLQAHVKPPTPTASDVTATSADAAAAARAPLAAQSGAETAGKISRLKRWLGG